MIGMLLILLTVGIGYICFSLWRLNKSMNEMQIIHKAILKKVVEIDNSKGVEAHRRIIKNLYGIYAALWGSPVAVDEPTPEGGYKSTVINRNF